MLILHESCIMTQLYITFELHFGYLLSYITTVELHNH